MDFFHFLGLWVTSAVAVLGLITAVLWILWCLASWFQRNP